MEGYIIMLGRYLLLSRLTEVTPAYVMQILTTTKPKASSKGVIRGTKIIKKLLVRAAKKGPKTLVTQGMDAAVHATRHPKVKKVVDVVNMIEPHYQGLPLHPGRW
jgi:hypothetical protein